MVLGFNVLDDSLADAAWPYIASPEAIEFNQAWQGFSGGVYYQAPETTAYSPCGWGLKSCSVPSALYLYKAQGNETMAVLLVNNANTRANVTLDFTKVPKLVRAPGYLLRDIWAREPAASAATVTSANTARTRWSWHLEAAHFC
jgi:hypothetical protein